MLVADEGQVLNEIASRKGSTLLATLRTGWSGGALGQTNASVETRRLIKDGAYRLCAVFALQPEHASRILNDAGSGTPQRLHWFWQGDTGACEQRPEYPGPLQWERPAIITLVEGLDPPPMDVAPDVVNEIDQHALAQLRGDGLDMMEAKDDLGRLKFAALLAILNGRTNVTVDDWRLAGIALDVSKAVRAHITALAVADVRRKQHDADERAVNRAKRIAQTVGETDEQRALASMAKSIGRKAHREQRTITHREAVRATAGKHQLIASVEDAIGWALSMRWIRRDGDGFAPDQSVA
jgi:hypothetical protein